MILVLGAGGLLGSTLCRLYPKDTLGFTHDDIDAFDLRKMESVIQANKPDVVVNGIGAVGTTYSEYEIKYLNGEFPHLLREICTRNKIRLIHISTDCVFNGDRGMYAESDPPDATDPYGISKAAGEFVYKPHLVIRTSFIGYPDPAGRGLLSWLFSKRGQEVRGFSRVWWNGVTVDTLSDIIMQVAYKWNKWGACHIVGETVSKYMLLKMVNGVYDLGCTIIPDQTPCLDKTLKTIYPEFDAFQPNMTTSAQIFRMKERLGSA